MLGQPPSRTRFTAFLSGLSLTGLCLMSVVTCAPAAGTLLIYALERADWCLELAPVRTAHAIRKSEILICCERVCRTLMLFRVSHP